MVVFLSRRVTSLTSLTCLTLILGNMMSGSRITASSCSRVAVYSPMKKMGIMRGGGIGSLAPIKAFVGTVKDAKKHLAAAAVARSVSIFTMYPVDTIKTRAQMGQKFSWNSLYGGVGGSMLGQVPYGVLTFGSYEIYKQYFLSRFPSVKPIFLYALSAILGDVTGSAWLCPSEVVKQQLQAGMHSSTISAVKHISKTKGLSGFYQGYFGGLARDVPFRVAQLTSYEVTKNLYLRMNSKTTLTPGDSALCGAIAGTFSAAITNPLDRIKTLLMTDSLNNGGNVVGCATMIFRNEGISGFCKGIVPRVAYIAPSVAIFFIAYEQVQQKFT